MYIYINMFTYLDKLDKLACKLFNFFGCYKKLKRDFVVFWKEKNNMK